MICQYAEHDAAYLLGALDPAERAEYQLHLRGCAQCRAGVADLAALPGLLSRVRAEPVQPVPAGLLPGLLARVRAQRRVARWRLAAAAALAGAAAATVIVLLPGAGAPQPAAVQMTAAAEAPVTAAVVLTERGWGTSIDMLCSYDASLDGYDKAPSYALYAIDDEGVESQVSSWYALDGREITVPGATSLARDSISALEVRSSYGETVLTLNL